MSDRLELDRPVPAALMERVRTGIISYQNYPVFSWPWFRGRALGFGLVAGSLGALIGLSIGLSRGQVEPALSLVGHFLVAAVLMTSAGPALATWVRHKRWPLRRERPLVVAALAVGLVISAVTDHWASSAIEQTLRGADVQSPPIGDLSSSPLGMVVGLGIAGLIYGMLGGGLAVGRYFAEDRKYVELARERSLAALTARQHELEARLGLLQAQVEPHFLFNTLASVHSLITSDAAAARTLVDELANYLRATIPRIRDEANRVDSTLGQQLEICESYLQVMRIRRGGQLEFSKHIEPGLEQALFPPLLLMTLVENAIKHGIEPKRGAGHVTLRAWTGEDGALTVRVADDGVGLSQTCGTGVGLSNLRQWLQARYGNQARFTLEGKLGEGAEATVYLPLERSSPSTP